MKEYFIFKEPLLPRNLIEFGVILLVFFILRKFVVNYIIKIIKRFAEKHNYSGITMTIDSIYSPLLIILTITGVYLSINRLPLLNSVVSVLVNSYMIIIAILSGIGVIKLIDSYYKFVLNNSTILNKKPVFRTLFPLITKGLKCFVILLVGVFVLSLLGFKEIQSVLTGVGIGGLAVAMAAQDLLKNVFGGFIILTDRSFNVGDFIKVESNEGIVEEVGIRSTKVRTLEQELVIVPNSKFVDGALLNYSRRGSRRVKQIVGATYSTTSEQLRNIISQMEKYLVESNKVVKDSVIVKFQEFGASSIDILVMYRINTADYKEYLEFKETVNFEIMKIFEKNKVEFAYPSVSVYMEK